MIKLVETATFKDGTSKVSEKEFASRQTFIKAMQNGGLSGKLVYDLTKHGEAHITYDDAKVHIKVIDDGPKIVLTDARGNIK